MRITMTAVVALALAAGATTLQAGGAKKDEQKILGTWTMVSGEHAGDKVSDDVVQGFRLTFAAEGKIAVKVDDKDHAGTFKLDTAKKPKEIDFTVDGKDMPGIYELKKDALKVCVAKDGGARPAEFSTQAGTELILLVLKREKQ